MSMESTARRIVRLQTPSTTAMVSRSRLIQWKRPKIAKRTCSRFIAVKCVAQGLIVSISRTRRLIAICCKSKLYNGSGNRIDASQSDQCRM